METKTVMDLKEGDKFRFEYDPPTRIRTAEQIGKIEIYCPHQFSNPYDGEAEVYLKSNSPVIMIPPLVQASGLDPDKPYSLGNKTYYYIRECNSGHTDLKDEEIAFTGGHYDGYDWAVPCCLRCIRADKEYPAVMQHSHNKKVHLKEYKPQS